MGRHVRQGGMQIPPQLLDKLPDRIIYVSYQGIPAGLNHCQKIIRCQHSSGTEAIANHGNWLSVNDLSSLAGEWAQNSSV
jgi:hypothetical protein